MFWCSPLQSISPTSGPTHHNAFLSLYISSACSRISYSWSHDLFCVWLFMLSIKLLRSIHIVAYIVSSFIFIAQEIYVLWIQHNMFIHPPIEILVSGHCEYKCYRYLCINFLFRIIDTCRHFF